MNLWNHGQHGRASLTLALLGFALSAVAVEPAISVSARQRYPWNGLVDLNFTITGDAGTKYDTSFTAKDMVGNTNIAMRTIRKADGTAAAAKELLLPGTYSRVWDAAVDLPKDFHCDRVTVTATAGIAPFPYSVKFNANGGTGTMSNESFTYGTAKALTANAFTRTGYTFQGWATSASGNKVYNNKQTVSNLTTTAGAVVNLYAKWNGALYMVVDLSSGASSSSYPVSYLSAVPSGGWGDTYKTTKLVLRRIDPGTFSMGGSVSTRITKPYYIGVFELTQKQYALILGSNPSGNLQYSVNQVDNWAVDSVYYDTGLRGSNDWPSSDSVATASVCGRMRARTGNRFDLPTEAQWEYACLGGTQDQFGGTGLNGSSLLGSNSYDAGYVVGTRASNSWGLYEMNSGMWEWCLDYYGTITGGDDPKGALTPVSDVNGPRRVLKGGATQKGDGCHYATGAYARMFEYSHAASSTYRNMTSRKVGARLCCPAN